MMTKALNTTLNELIDLIPDLSEEEVLRLSSVLHGLTEFIAVGHMFPKRNATFREALEGPSSAVVLIDPVTPVVERYVNRTGRAPRKLMLPPGTAPKLEELMGLTVEHGLLDNAEAIVGDWEQFPV